MRILVIIIASLQLLFFASRASGQDTASSEEFRLLEPGEILALRRGQAAPRDGLLVDSEDMLRISQEYDRMRYLLTRTEERDREVCDVRVEMERARLTACEERLALRDELWSARQSELLAAVAAANERAAQAAQRGWWESPLLWAIVGGVVVGVVWIAAEVR